MKRDLIVFGEDWGRHPSSTQHLISRMAKDRRVLWINSVGMRRPKAGFKDAKRIVEKACRMLSTPQSDGGKVSVPESMTVIDPKVLPFPGCRVAARLNQSIGGRQLAAAIEKAGLENPVIWVSVPTAVDLLPALPEAPVVYYCGDDFGGLDGVDHAPVLECEARLAKKAKRVFTVSDILSAKFDTEKVFDLPHGVDFELFSRPAARPDDLPTNKKVAGFYGSISAWLDQDLLCEVASKKPDWAFVFVGNINCDVSRLDALPNVEFLGSRPHDALPGYAQHWDVSMLPFVDNAQIRACNPLKLREYMAAGTPIAATPFPALEAYGEWIMSTPNADHFANFLEVAIIEGQNPARRAQRSAVVASESWENRARTASSVIDAL